MTSRYSSRDDIISSFSLPSHFYSTASRRPTITPVATREGKQVDDPSPNDINLSFLRLFSSYSSHAIAVVLCKVAISSCPDTPFSLLQQQQANTNTSTKERKKEK